MNTNSISDLLNQQWTYPILVNKGVASNTLNLTPEFEKLQAVHECVKLQLKIKDTLKELEKEQLRALCLKCDNFVGRICLYKQSSGYDKNQDGNMTQMFITLERIDSLVCYLIGSQLKLHHVTYNIKFKCLEIFLCFTLLGVRR